MTAGYVRVTSRHSSSRMRERHPVHFVESLKQLLFRGPPHPAPVDLADDAEWYMVSLLHSKIYPQM